MRTLTEVERRSIIALLERGEPLPAFYKDLLFPRSESREIWRFCTDDAVVSSPCQYEDTVYCGSRDGNLYALDALTGTMKWRFPTTERIDCSPIAVEGRVYCGGNDGFSMPSTAAQER